MASAADPQEYKERMLELCWEHFLYHRPYQALMYDIEKLGNFPKHNFLLNKMSMLRTMEHYLNTSGVSEEVLDIIKGLNRLSNDDEYARSCEKSHRNKERLHGVPAPDTKMCSDEDGLANVRDYFQRKELGPPPGQKILLEVMTAVAVRFLGGKPWEVAQYRDVLEKVWSDPGDESEDDDVDAAESNHLQQQKARRMELFAAVDNKSLQAKLIQKYPVAEAATLVRRYMDDSWAWFGRPSLDGIAEQVLLGNLIMRTDAVWGEGREGRDGGGGHGDGADSLGGPSMITDGGLAGGGECDTEVGCPKGYVTVAVHDLIRSWFPEGLNRGARKLEDLREEKQQQDQVQRKQGQSQDPQGKPKQQQQQSTRAQNQEEAYEAVQQVQNHEAAPSAAATTAAAVSGDAEQMVRELRESSARLKAVGQDPLPDALRLAEAAKAQVRDQARGKAEGEARNGGLGEEREVVQGSKARGGGRKERVGLEHVREEEEEEEGEEDRRTNEAGMRRKWKKKGEEGGRRVASETWLEVLGKGEGERRRRGEDGREEDGEGRDGGGRRRRMMDPQPTARILEWSEDDGELEETPEPAQPHGPSNRHGRTSMPATVHLRTPSAPHLSPLNLHAASPGTAAGAAARGGMGQGVRRRGGTVTATGRVRRPKRPFSAEETDTLKIGVMRFGKSWSQIMHEYADVFAGRTQVDLKDKYRNLERAGEV